MYINMFWRQNILAQKRPSAKIFAPERRRQNVIDPARCLAHAIIYITIIFLMSDSKSVKTRPGVGANEAQVFPVLYCSYHE